MCTMSSPRPQWRLYYSGMGCDATDFCMASNMGFNVQNHTLSGGRACICLACCSSELVGKQRLGHAVRPKTGWSYLPRESMAMTVCFRLAHDAFLTPSDVTRWRLLLHRLAHHRHTSARRAPDPAQATEPKIEAKDEGDVGWSWCGGQIMQKKQQRETGRHLVRRYSLCCCTCACRSLILGQRHTG